MKLHSVLFLTTVVFLISLVDASHCNDTCGTKKLPYPFGFSSGCRIQLNCTSNGTILIADFPVESVNGEAILVNLQAQCNRPVEELHRLFRSNFAPNSHNAILLQNCTAAASGDGGGCVIPSTMVQTHFEQLGCDSGQNRSISCYSETSNTTEFIDYRNLMRRSCRSVVSAISTVSANDSSMSLDVQTMRVGWWLHGNCSCAKNANCVKVAPPPPIHGNTNATAYRCVCEEGFAGDGFSAGSGCRKESLCNPSKYLSGRCGGTTRVGALVGGVVAGASLMITLGLIICFIKKKSKLRSRSRKNRQLRETNGIKIPVYAYKDMEKATDRFSEKRCLGNGAYGTVYSGKMNNDEWVAIKRIRHRDAGSDQVINEIKLLSSVSHPNLVRLLGCSIENEEQILVYEYMPNGTLCQHLQREKGTGLSWSVRLAIASETAQAISYLHNAMYPPIYHRDIKSSNILLDSDFKSKVADFGLSRLGLVESSHISTAPQGTPGYLDPQYHQHFHLSDKSDVYSFGVVLIEIITGLRVVDFSRPQNEVNLAALAVDRIGKGCLDDIIDPFLEHKLDAWTLTSVHKIAELAFRCLAFHQDMRPSMMEVAIELEQIRQSKWTFSDMSIIGSSEGSPSLRSSSNLSEKPLNVMVKKNGHDNIGVFSSATSMDTVMDFSPVSAEDSWRSDQSSPSSSSLLNRVVR